MEDGERDPAGSSPAVPPFITVRTAGNAIQGVGNGVIPVLREARRALAVAFPTGNASRRTGNAFR
jgi:hypothetical protein